MALADLASAQPPPTPPPRSHADLFGDPIDDSSPLWFKKDLFLSPDFDSESYISDLRTFVPFDTLRSQLHAHLSSLKHQLVDLINRDYNDFVNLSTNLVDVDSSVARMRAPLSDLREKIAAFRDSVQDSLISLQNGLNQRAEAANAREVLELLLDTFHVVSKVEKLIKELPSVPADWSNGDMNASEKNHLSNGISLQQSENESNVRETQSMLLERIASEMNRLKFYMAHAKDLPFIQNVEKRFQSASHLLDASLGHCFLDGLEHRDENAIYNCLRAYAAIDSTSNAEEIFRSTIVAPLIEKIIPHGSSGLNGVASVDELEADFREIKQCIEKDCTFLLRISSREDSGAAHLVDSTNQVGHFQSVLTAIGNFCICSIAVGMLIEIIVMYPIQHRKYRDGIDNLLVLLIGGIPIAMPTVLSVTMAIGSHKLSEQGAITKRMTAIEEMAGMDVLCSDKTGTLTLNKLTVDKNLIEVFAKGVEKEYVLLLAARASRTENQDAIDAAMVGMLADPKEARAGIREVHFFPFNPVDKRTALTYIDANGNWHRASKGAPEQIIDLCRCKEDVKKKVHKVIESYAERGLRSLAVARQEVPEKTKESPGGPWQFVGLLPLFDPPRHDSADTISKALNLGVNVKMITGDQLAIAKETGRRLGMGTNMYPSSSLLGQDKSSNVAGLPVDELIEKADGFAGVFPEHKYEIVKRLQERKHICGMTGDGVNDAPALKKADIGIAVDDATDAARSASDIVLTEPGLSVIISAVLTSRAIFQRMKNYTIYAVSITIRVVFGFMFIALIWKFDFSPFMVLIIAILNDGTIMTISKDRVKPSPLPDSWKLNEIFATGVVLGGYQALMTVIFFWLMSDTTFFTDKFHVKPLTHDQMMAALYLQVSVISQALIFVTRSRSWSFVERPGLLLLGAFLIAQLIATAIAVYANFRFAKIEAMGWGWAGVVWIYSLVTYLPLDVLKFLIRYALSGRAWNNLLENKTAFTTKKDYGKEEREAQWATAQRTLHGLQPPPESTTLFNEKSNYRELSEIAEQAKRRAEVARLRELHTLKGHVESVVKLKGLDIENMQQHYTV